MCEGGRGGDGSNASPGWTSTRTQRNLQSATDDGCRHAAKEHAAQPRQQNQRREGWADAAQPRQSNEQREGRSAHSTPPEHASVSLAATGRGLVDALPHRPLAFTASGSDAQVCVLDHALFHDGERGSWHDGGKRNPSSFPDHAMYHDGERGPAGIPQLDWPTMGTHRGIIMGGLGAPMTAQSMPMVRLSTGLPMSPGFPGGGGGLSFPPMGMHYGADEAVDVSMLPCPCGSGQCFVACHGATFLDAMQAMRGRVA